MGALKVASQPGWTAGTALDSFMRVRDESTHNPQDSYMQLPLTGTRSPMQAPLCHEEGSPHGKWPLTLPGGACGKVDNVIMAWLQPLGKEGVLAVPLTELGKIHGVVPV